MNSSRRIFRPVALILIAAQLGIAAIPAAQAGMLSAENVLDSNIASASQDRQAILSVLARDEVRAQLMANGISPVQAATRVAALSDYEASSLAREFENAPAGSSFAGLVVVFFFGWALMNITDWGDIFMNDKPAAE
jgi:hypothetical protein